MIDSQLYQNIKSFVASEQQSSLSDAAGEPDRHEEDSTEGTGREDLKIYITIIWYKISHTELTRCIEIIPNM